MYVYIYSPAVRYDVYIYKFIHTHTYKQTYTYICIYFNIRTPPSTSA